jgi:hypothetical protein
MNKHTKGTLYVDPQGRVEVVVGILTPRHTSFERDHHIGTVAVGIVSIQAEPWLHETICIQLLTDFTIEKGKVVRRGARSTNGHI